METVRVERVGVWFSTKRDLDFRSVRLPTVVSPFAPRAAVTAFVSHSFMAAAAGEEFVFPVEPDVGMSTIYIADVVRGILRFMDADANQLSRRVYNVHGFGPTASEIATAIRDELPHSSIEESFCLLLTKPAVFARVITSMSLNREPTQSL